MIHLPDRYLSKIRLVCVEDFGAIGGTVALHMLRQRPRDYNPHDVRKTWEKEQPRYRHEIDCNLWSEFFGRFHNRPLHPRLHIKILLSLFSPSVILERDGLLTIPWENFTFLRPTPVCLFYPNPPPTRADCNEFDPEGIYKHYSSKYSDYSKDTSLFFYIRV